MFPSSWALCWGSHFLLPQRWENEKKLFTQNQMRHRGFCIWDIRPGVLDHLQSVKLIPELYTLESGSYFLFPQRGKKWEKWIRTKWDDTSDMGNILRPCCQSGVDRGITLKRAFWSAQRSKVNTPNQCKIELFHLIHLRNVVSISQNLYDKVQPK